MISFGIFALGLSVLGTALSGTPAVALGAALLLGISAAYVLVPGQTLMQEETPPEILGRVSRTSMSLVTVCQVMSFLVAGASASVIGIRHLDFIVALVLVTIGAGGYWYARANRLAEPHHYTGASQTAADIPTDMPVIEPRAVQPSE